MSSSRLLPVACAALLSLLLGCSAAVTRPEHAKRLPPELDRVWFGMSLAEYEKLHGQAAQDLTMSFRIEVEQAAPGGDVVRVIYYFDAEGDRPLYEAIVEYREGVDVQALARTLYGDPNDQETEWSFPTSEGFTFRAWVFEQKIVVMGTLPGTEWSE
ncbi:MAG: hypothetical protein FJ098_11080 [Deltaproteobacteria bacterium]|nr:hypothetical protein [Deltaproteobacteria bacterium]